ncbi:hypothetical protein C0J52_11874 [Blattella germanica]|nr:hypothetical protein C0J52_11874 [Blattella germanica]
MKSWTAPLWCMLILLSLTQGQDDQTSDSLRTAIEAVSRRQRDLATAGDGQPENIGYGYQKTIASPSGMFPQPPLDGPGPISPEHVPKSKMLEKMLVDYLEEEMADEKYGDEGDDNEAYYHKRSAFRERTDDGRHNYDGVKKRGRFRSIVPSAFRERVHGSSLVNDMEEQKRKVITEALLKKMEQEEDERKDKQRGRIYEDEDAEEEYLDVLKNVWEKYRKNNPQVIDIEDISEGDVGEILNYFGNSGFLDDDDIEGIKDEVSKRQYGNYDFNTHNAAMGGWGGHGFKKRWNQRLDGEENQKGNFLYSLKFVSPAINREAIESLKNEDDLELPDERDEDVLRLTSDVRREPDPWFPAFERGEAPEELFGNPGEEEYQRLLLAQQNDRQPSMKRIVAIRPHYSIRESSPPEVFLSPEKKYMYDTAIMKKRFPVAKRSSNFYTSPPLLHHKNFAFMDSTDARKKKDALGNSVATTDPKVAREINQIFSSPIAGEHVHDDLHAKDISKDSSKSSSEPLQVTTTHAPVVVSSTAVTKTKENSTEKSDKDSKSIQKKPGSVEQTVGQPITMSRSETPLDIKKKSINWSEYFGIDKRRKKTELDGSAADSNSHPVDNEWLLNQYKTFAMTTNPDKKKSILHSHDQAKTVKYTGAHEGTTDSKEIQKVKDKVMARLAAAYSLEKMRQALGEYNPENIQSANVDEKKKRVAVKKEKAEEKKDDDKEKRGSDQPDSDEDEEFLDGPIAVQPISEGDMGRQDLNDDDDLLSKVSN